MRPSAASRAAAAARAGEGLDVGDQVVGGHHQHDRRRVAARGEAGGERDRGQRVAALGLERELDRGARRRGLVGDEEAATPRR